MGHWYKEDGTACHTVIGKNGKEKKTTLREARSLGLYPSVTTILKILASPELERWGQKQVLMASLTLPRIDGESEDDFADRVIKDAFKQVDDAADLGTRIHAAIEDYFQGRNYDTTLDPYIIPVKEWVERNGVTIIENEIRCVDKEYGYAGTTDAVVSINGKDGLYLLDWKSRKTKTGQKVTPWAKEPMQLAAYARVKGAVGACNVYISTTEVGRIEEAWYDAERLEKEFDTFKHIVAVWQAMNNYKPA